MGWTLLEKQAKTAIEKRTIRKMGAPPVNQTPATDWQFEVRRENVISITVHQVF